ncbi:MAG: DsbE family thiol:disulfide interchange protein [Alphaproteobacteria bacterium]|nr:DsbE family thiol:disulfide interchange protein [Alphaproteobacteria bacterium]
MIRLVTYLPLAVAALLAVVFLWALDRGRDPSLVPSPLIDKPAPEFTLAGFDGGPKLTDADLKGGVTVVNVFASWCLPCRAEHPYLMALARDGKARIFGINYKDKAEDAKAWLKELGNPYARIGADANGRVAIEWGVYGVPETFVVDAAGRIRMKHVGPLTPDRLEEIRGMIADLVR